MSVKNVLSFKVSTTLSAYRIVSAVSSTANTVEYPPNAQVKPIGVTIDDVKDTNQAIPVCVSGIAKVYFNDTVTSGKLVASDSSGRGIPFSVPVFATTTDLTLPTGVVGILVGPTIGLTGTIADVLVQPQLVR